MENNKYENKEICSKCGGRCCKKCGCDYFVSDFESMKIDYLESVLDTGRVSVIAALDFKRVNEKLLLTPLLYLRARNINRDEIDLLSMKTTCASLENDGCHFNIDERPSGGSSLIPSDDGLCKPSVDFLTEIKKWEPYQKVLSRLVKRRTGLSVDEKLREDAKKLFYDVITENFNHVAEIEIEEIKELIPMLAQVYPKELIEATILAKNNLPLKRTK